MSWYVIAIGGERGPNVERPYRQLLVWDLRSKRELATALVQDGYVELEWANDHKRGGSLQSQGTIVIFASHAISIEDRMDIDGMQPGGPTPFELEK